MNGHLKQQVYAASLAVAKSTKYDGIMFITTNGYVFGHFDDKVSYEVEYNIIRLKNVYMKVLNEERLLSTNQLTLNLEYVVAVYPIEIEQELNRLHDSEIDENS